jgi:soluble P-type ATPase
MKKNNAICVLMLILTGMFYGTPTILADVTVQSGSTLTINSATLDMNCTDIIVAEGATLDLVNGVIDELGDLAVDPGGAVITASGTINPCAGASQVAVSGSDVFAGNNREKSGGSCFIKSLSDH